MRYMYICLCVFYKENGGLWRRGQTQRTSSGVDDTERGNTAEAHMINMSSFHFHFKNYPLGISIQFSRNTCFKRDI